jgi:hypothetical protein
MEKLGSKKGRVFSICRLEEASVLIPSVSDLHRRILSHQVRN